jgi:hypothetical protein
MNAACPSCAAQVTYFASDIGGMMRCGSCEAALQVSADGLSLLGGAAAKSANPGGTPVSTAPRPAPSAGDVPLTGTAKLFNYLEWFNWGLGWLYVPGLFLVLLFVFMPKIDSARLERMRLSWSDNNAPWKKKEIELKEKRNKTEEEKFTKKKREWDYKNADLQEKRRELESRNPYNDTKSTEEAKKKWDEEKKALDTEQTKLSDEKKTLDNEYGGLNYTISKSARPDQEKLDKERKEWETKVMFMQLDFQDAENAAKTRAIYYYLGQIFATILLMLGAIGYLSPKESQLRRIVGVVTIGAVVLLVVALLNGGHSVLFGLALLLRPKDPRAYTTTSR